MAEVWHITHDANNWNEYDAGVPPGGSKVALSMASALGGSVYGLAVDVTAAGISIIEKDLSGISNSATVIRFGFRLDLNGIVKNTSSAETLFYIEPGAGLEFCDLIWLRENGSGGFNIEVETYDDDSTTHTINSATLPSGDITIEVVWDKPSSTSSNDGACTIYVNGVSSGSTITTLDNFDNFEDVTGQPSPNNVLVLDLGSNGGGSDSGTLYLDEFILRDDATPIYPPPGTFTGQRALVQAIDQEAGAIVYLTSWEDGSLYLYNRDLSDLSEVSKADFGAAAATALTSRSNYLAPYTPLFPDIASFGDYVYAYGRWDDGSVKHLALSTSAGATGTFGSNLGDASWAGDWVGAFFADDSSTFYAFVNGSSRALWRSVNGGSAWTSLSSLPFDVDPGGAVKHPDGRILIINRAAGSQMVAIASPPDYSSWANATGVPAFPQAGGGARSVKWIV